MAKKYHKSEHEVDRKGKKHKQARWSEGFASTKAGKISRTNKPKKTDDVEFEDGTVMLIDENAEVLSVTGKVQFFAIEGATLKINGKKVV